MSSSGMQMQLLSFFLSFLSVFQMPEEYSLLDKSMERELHDMSLLVSGYSVDVGNIADPFCRFLVMLAL